jgi:hypothetical protein
MDRQTLARTLDAGRTSTLNCFATTADIAAMSAEVRESDAIGPLFSNKYLNNTIILKVIAQKRQHQRRTYTTDTLIYFPYNAENIYEGGDSVLYSDAKRDAKLRHKCGFDPDDPAQQADVEHDNRLLELLADIPTLDPFLLREKAMQMDIEGDINPVYFNLTQEEWSTFQAPIRDKIDALVRKALGVTHNLETSDIADHVSNFLDKIWEARDIESIEGFVDSMEIPRERAPELFFAWKAICYYQARTRALEPSLKRLFQWIGDSRTALPIDLMTLRKELREQIDAEITLLKQGNGLDPRHLRGQLSAVYRAWQPRAVQAVPRRCAGAVSSSCRLPERQRPCGQSDRRSDPPRRPTSLRSPTPRIARLPVDDL